MTDPPIPAGFIEDPPIPEGFVETAATAPPPTFNPLAVDATTALKIATHHNIPLNSATEYLARGGNEKNAFAVVQREEAFKTSSGPNPMGPATIPELPAKPYEYVETAPADILALDKIHPGIADLYRNNQEFYNSIETVRLAPGYDPSSITMFSKMSPALANLSETIQDEVGHFRGQQEAYAKQGFLGKTGTQIGLAAKAGIDLVSREVGSPTTQTAWEAERKKDAIARTAEIDKYLTSGNLYERMVAHELKRHNDELIKAWSPGTDAVIPAAIDTATFSLFRDDFAFSDLSLEQQSVESGTALGMMLVPYSPPNIIFGAGMKGAALAEARLLSKFPKVAKFVGELSNHTLTAVPLGMAREAVQLKAGEITLGALTPKNLQRLGEGEEPLDILKEHIAATFSVDPMMATFAVALGGWKGIEASSPKAIALRRAHSDALRELKLPANATDDQIKIALTKHVDGLLQTELVNSVPRAALDLAQNAAQTTDPTVADLLKKDAVKAVRESAPDGYAYHDDVQVMAAVEKAAKDPVRAEHEKSVDMLMQEQGVDRKQAETALDAMVQQERSYGGSGTGKSKTSTLAARVEAEAVAKNLAEEFPGLAKYEKMSMADELANAQKLADADPAKALAVAMGTEPPPSDVRVASVYKLVEHRALAAGDVETLRRLATESSVPEHMSKLGQEIAAAGQVDPHSPVKAMQTVLDARKAALARRSPNGKLDDIVALRGKLAAADKALIDVTETATEPDSRKAYNDAHRRITQPTKKSIDEPGFFRRNKVFTLASIEADIAKLSNMTFSDVNAAAEGVKVLAKLAGAVIEAGIREVGAFAKWVREKGAKVSDEKIQSAWDKAYKGFYEQRKSDILAKITENTTNLNSRDVIELAKTLIADGVTGQQELLDATHAQLKAIDPEITRRQVQDALGEYGKVRELSKDAVSIVYRQRRAEYQKLSAIADVLNKLAPKKTGMEHEPPTDATRALTKELHRLMKEAGIETTDPARQLKSTLDGIKTRLSNEISDAEDRLAAHEDTWQAKTPTQYDTEATALRGHLDMLREQELAMFGRKELTTEQRVKIAISAAESAAEKAGQKIAQNDLAAKRGAPLPLTPELVAARAFNAEMQKALRELREAAKQKPSDAERSIAQQEKSLLTRIEQVKSELESGQRSNRDATDRPTSDRIQALQSELDLLNGIHERMFPAERKPMTDEQKIKNALVAAEKSQVRYQTLIDSGTYADLFGRKADAQSPTDPALDAARAGRDAAGEEVRALKELLSPKRSADEIAARTFLAAKARDQARFEALMASGNYEKAAPKPERKLSAQEKVAKGKRDMLADQVRALAGITITPAEAAEIVDLSKKAMATKDAMDAGPRRNENSDRATPTELAHGLATVNFYNRIAELKQAANKTTLADVKAHPVEFGVITPIKTALGLSRSLMASFDNSFIGRQGIRALYTSDIPDALMLLPRAILGKTHKGPSFIWSQSMAKSFEIIYKRFGGKPMMDTIQAVIVSDPDYALMRKARIATATIEEQFPEHLKIADRGGRLNVPGLIYRASEEAFTGTAHYMRYMLAKKYFAVARAAGVDLTDTAELIGIGTLVNSLTAKGGDPLRRPGVINNVFWSPGMMRAHLDVFTAHAFDPKATKFAKKQAASNLVEIVVGIAGVQAISAWIDPDSADWDVTSSDAGQIKVGNTRFDVTGGFRGVAVLATRLATFAYAKATDQPMTLKSTTSGKETKINTGKFGGRTMLDVVEQFLENKTAPAASEIVKHLQGDDRKGGVPTAAGSLANLFVPLPIKTAQELWNDPNSAPFIAAMLADMLGISTNTYPPKPVKLRR